MTVEELYQYAFGQLIEKDGRLIWVSDHPEEGDLREILESSWEERVDMILSNESTLKENQND